METTSFKLRHSIQPYRGFVTIYVALAVLFITISATTKDWRDSIAPLLVLTAAFATLFAFWMFLNLRYEVALENDTITMRSSSLISNPTDLTSIRIADIASIKKETSGLHASVKLRRPFRRVAIYAEHGGNIRWIDVSLKHFLRDDIRRLMDAIHDRRPDLSLPQV